MMISAQFAASADDPRTDRGRAHWSSECLLAEDWTGSELPFFIRQSTRPAPVSKSGAGCHAIGLLYNHRDNHRVLGLLVAGYSHEHHHALVSMRPRGMASRYSLRYYSPGLLSVG